MQSNGQRKIDRLSRMATSSRPRQSQTKSALRLGEPAAGGGTRKTCELIIALMEKHLITCPACAAEFASVVNEAGYAEDPCPQCGNVAAEYWDWDEDEEFEFQN